MFMARSSQIWIGLLLSLCWWLQVFAAWATRFDVVIDPDTIVVWEYADITIKAVDDQWNVVQEFWASWDTEDIEIWVEWFGFKDPNVELPWWWLYFFKPADQWIKVFSKGLSIKTPGKFTVKVADLFADVSWLEWEATITVKEEWSWVDLWSLEVVAPLSWSVLTDERVTVQAKTSLPNSPIVMYVDWEKVQEWLSDQQWWVTMYISWIKKGEHTLLVNAVDLWWNIIATSEDIPFSYDPIDHWSLFVWLEILPSNNVLEWDKVTVKVTTAEIVDSVSLTIWDGDPLATTKWDKKWTFVKDLLMEDSWVYPVDLWITVDWSTTTQQDVDTITVSKDIKKILTLTYDSDIANNKVDLVWTYTWRVDFFKLEYGMQRENLDLSLTSSIPNGKILLTDPTKERYAQVYPVDSEGNVIWDPSDIIRIDPLRDPTPVCWNKVIELGEECDDGNTQADDGCSIVCKIELASCWNRKIELGEECDDGNNVNNDWCSAVCKIEIALCGNWRIELGEQCDDGNTTDGDWCSASCMLLASVCWNWALEIGEECDDWNIRGWDGCSESCRIQQAWSAWDCNVSWIEINSKMIWSRHYLYWNPVSWASNYYVYRRENRPGSLAQMSLVWETVDPLFEYPFDPNAGSDMYAWYAVEAECDQEKQQLWDFTQVKVWPEETMLIIFLASMLFWSMWKFKGKSL